MLSEPGRASDRVLANDSRRAQAPVGPVRHREPYASAVNSAYGGAAGPGAEVAEFFGSRSPSTGKAKRR